MVAINDIKKLRHATGAGFLDCKKALEGVDGDYDKAYQHIREQGQLKAEGKSDRVAENGTVLTRHEAGVAVMIEINCETDFVARNASFQAFAQAVLDAAYTAKASDVATLSALPLAESASVEHARKALVTTIGENIIVRRCVCIAVPQGDTVVSYQHGTRIGVLLHMQGGSIGLGEEIAMHIAAAAPMALHASDIPEEILQQERAIAAARVAQMNKPEHIAHSIVQGMVAKFVDAHTLGGQEFIMDSKHKVADVLKNNKAHVVQYARYALGEAVAVQGPVDHKQAE